VFRPGLVIGKICFKKIRKKEYFQHGKNDEKLDENYEPQFFSHRHGTKTVYINL
jgi:hypothetical protein